MRKNPLVSIIITYYKKRIFLKRTLNSIFNQTYKNYELIFVYDDPDKKDLKFIKKELNKFKNKKIIINKKNLGVANSRNIALKFVKGSYLTFIDSDDIWKKNKITKQVKFMIKNTYDFSYTSYSIIDENNNITKHRIVDSDANYKNLSKSNFIGLNTVMINKRIFSLIKFPNLTTQEDFALWLKLCRKGIKLRHMSDNLSCWRKTSNSLSSNSFQKLKDAYILYNSCEKKNVVYSIYSILVLSYNKILNNYFK